MKFRRLGNKILLAMVAVILAISTSFLIYFVWYVGNLLEAQSYEAGMALVRNLAQSAELGVLTEEERFLRGPFDGVMSDSSVAYVVAYDRQGTIIKTSSRVDVDLALSPATLKRFINKITPTQIKSSIPGRMAATDFYAPVLIGAPDLDVVEELVQPDEKILRAGTVAGLVRIGLSEEGIAVARKRVLLFGIFVSLAVFLVTTMLIVGVARDARETRRLMGDLERRRQETEVARDSAEREQRRLMSLLFSISEGVLMFGPDGEVVVVNPFARRLLRVDRNVNVTRETLRRIEWLHIDEMLGEVLTNHEQSFVREVEVDFPVPQVIRIGISRVSTGDGRELGLVMVLHDVTEERRIDRMRDEFVATVSHDLRTPLTTIKGFLALLLGGRVGDLNEKQRQFLTNVDDSTQHLAELIDDLLDLSRIKAGKLVVKVEHVDLRDVIAEAVHLNHPAAEHKHLALDTKLPEKNCMADIDFERMKEALNNLISNAIKFTPEGGSITVEAIDGEAECKIKIHDTGIGIQKEYQDVIFDKFRSVPGHGEGVSLSTGLGLSIVKGIVEAHGGSVWVESEPGKGSTFTVVLPKHADSSA